jgi:hypothetical protein
MRNASAQELHSGMTRRSFVRLSAASAATLGLGVSHSSASFAERQSGISPALSGELLFSSLLQSWCDGLLKHQIEDSQGDALRGGLLCPACGIIHGRCGDAVYPLLHLAHTTGASRYIEAAIRAHEWSQRQVSRDDGSWVNDVTLSSWKGITVFHAIALGEALEHHGVVLDAKTRNQWRDRLAKAAKFLDGFINIETGNINYPVTSSYCFALCGQVLEEHRYIDRGREMAHAALNYFTPQHILFGEGHPLNDVSPKGCRPVDLGYNVEESLPALSLYSILTGDSVVRDKVVDALRTHMEFMLPDGAWDNSWGSRNYKWSWWGSRTSDGCQPAYVLLSNLEPRFLEVARRNTQLMADCTHDGLLYGGPDYFKHGDFPCIHHTFTHAKAIATALDRGKMELKSTERYSLPRDEAYTVKSFPEIGTYLASVGDWRATVTENDWEYIEKVQSGSGGAGGGHATGGALSILFHKNLGPILTGSMTDYQLVEISNQQTFRDAPHMTLTPRVECAGTQVYTSLNDLSASLRVNTVAEGTTFAVTGRLQTTTHQRPIHGDTHYHLEYHILSEQVEIVVRLDSAVALPAPANFILPVISQSEEQVKILDAKSVEIKKAHGHLVIHTDSAAGFLTIPSERTFNLVPGFECLPLQISLTPGESIRVTLREAKN